MVSLPVCIVFALHAVCTAETVSPIQKVVELLQENKLKIQADLEAESKEMEDYSGFCDDELKEKSYAIKTADRSSAGFNAVIQDADAQISGYADEVATLGTETASREKQLAGATGERMQAKTDFEASEKELVEAVDQLERAVVVVKRSESFLQAKGTTARVPQKDVKIALAVLSKIIDAGWINESTRKTLKEFMQTTSGSDSSESDDLSLKMATGAASSQQGSGVVEQLETMGEKAEETLSDSRTAEMKAQHNFDMMASSLTEAIKISKDKLSSAKSSTETMTQEKAKAAGDLALTQRTKAADNAYMASLKAECTAAHENWASRQQTAQDEMAAIEKAKSILADRVKVFLQTVQKGVVDEPVTSDEQDGVRRELVGKLRDLSHKFGSYALMEMVTAASADPFEKIKGLIEQMIQKLQDEANQEATQKGFCDEETSKSNASKDVKTMKIDKLQSRIDKAAATQAELEQSVKDLDAEVASIDKGDAEATKIRQADHATNLKASNDFKGAAEAVNEAITVLKEYYTSLLQTQSVSQRQPKFGGPKVEAGSVIISILGMSAENFGKMYMQTEQAEAEAADAYAKLLNENKVSKAAKQAEVKGALSEIKSLEVALRSGKQDYQMTSQELDAVMAYLDKLKPQCETKAMAYEEKKARRAAEINGLKEAVSILDTQSA